MIEVDEQGLKLINILLDLALKAEGIKAEQLLNATRKGLKLKEETQLGIAKPE